MAHGIDELANLIRQRRTILFAGAGLSMAVGLPSWSKLIEHMCGELGIDNAGFTHPGDYQALAEYYRIQRGSIEPLVNWIRRHWQVSDEAVANSPIHRLIVELDFPIIYTTNYDDNLERAYAAHGRRYVKIADAQDLTHSAPDVTQIIKFHGDLESEDSLVLAESDYFARLRFEAPVDIKFRADALGRSVLFLGYSMSDMNIRLLLYRIWEVWKQSGLEKERPSLFLFTMHPNRVQQAVLEQRGIQMLTRSADDPQQAMTGFLSDLRDRVGSLDGCASHWS